MSKIRMYVFFCTVFALLSLTKVSIVEGVSVAGTDQYGCREVQVKCVKAPCPVQTICTEPPVKTIRCDWCGLGCADLSKGDIACIMIAPPEGKKCVENNGKCVVMPADPVSSCVDRPACLDSVPRCVMAEPEGGWCLVKKTTTTPTPPVGCYYKQVQCVRAPCYPILVCPSVTPTAKPTCIAEPACINGIIDPKTGVTIYCDPAPGVVYCPKVTPTPTSTGQYVTVTNSCVDSGSQAVVRVDNSKVDVWTVVEDVNTGEKIINSYSKNSSAFVMSQGLNNGVMLGIRDGSGYVKKLNLTQGSVYIVRAYTAPYTLFIPTNWQLIGEAKVILSKCTTTTTTQNLPGDANGDKKVDLVDFSFWKSEYISKLISKADFDKDGKVDLADFSIWKTGYLQLLTTPWMAKVTVTPLIPTPTVNAVTPTPTYVMPTVTTGNGKADLIVANFVSESDITPGMYSVRTVMANQGSVKVNVSEGFKVNLYVDPTGDPENKETLETSSSIRYDVLEVGSTISNVFDVNLTPGEHFFYSNIDVNNNVVEEVEDNNMSYVRYWVKETCDWCGNRCTKVTNACPLIPGPTGKSCVTENNSCIIKDN